MAKEILPNTKKRFLRFISSKTDYVSKTAFVEELGISLSTVNRLIEEYERAGLIVVQRFGRFTFVGPKNIKKWR